MSRINKIVKTGIIVGCLIVAMSGCSVKSTSTNATEDPGNSECPLPTSKLTDEAFEEAKQTLADPECAYRFEAVWDSLLEIASGDPDPENKEKFSDLAGWARKQGIISTIQTKEYYTRYFHPNFVSLPDNYRTCSYCNQLDKIKAELRDEMRQKELGLDKVTRDKKGIAKARSDYKAIKLVLTATCEACGSKNR